MLKRTETLLNVLVNVFMKIHSKRPSGCYDTGHAVRTFEYFFKDGYKIAFFLVSEAYFISCVDLGK